MWQTTKASKPAGSDVSDRTRRAVERALFVDDGIRTRDLRFTKPLLYQLELRRRGEAANGHEKETAQRR
jgi:hypothetical protein